MSKEYKLKKTKFQQESEKAGKSSAPSSTMLALFKPDNAEGVLDEMQRLNMPQMVKPEDRNGVPNIPVGGIVAGIIVDVIPSPKASIKGSLLWLHLVRFNGKKPEKTGNEITFPATGVIRQAMAPGATDKDKDKQENAAREMMLKYKGHLIIARRTGDGRDRNFNKRMFMWDIFLSPKPVDIGVKIH